MNAVAEMIGNRHTQYDIVIIGAGLAGLSAGALLARRGWRVLLLERSGSVGGRASFVERDGFVWEYGQHSHRLGPDGIAARVFRELGETIRWSDPAGHRAYLYRDGRLYPRPEGPLGFLRSPLLSFRARLTFLRVYKRLLGEDPALWYSSTLLEWYRERFRDPEVERLLSFLGLTVMLPYPERVSAGEVIQFLKRAAKARVKQGEPAGGMKQVLGTLERVFATYGGTLHRHERVQEILVKDGAAVGVRTDAAMYEASKVVAAFPLFRLFDAISERWFASDFAAYVKGIVPSSGVSIDFVFDEAPTPYPGSILGADLPLWVKLRSNNAPDMAPEGKYVSTWGLLLEPGVAATSMEADRIEACIKRIMEELFPGCLGNVRGQRRLLIPVVNGNILTPAQSYPCRPDIASRDVRGLFFIGDTTRGEGSSGDIAFSSALKLAGLLGGNEERMKDEQGIQESGVRS